MSRAYHLAAQAMARARIARIVVTLTTREVSDTPNEYATALVVERADHSLAPGSHDQLAELVWDAALAQFGGNPDHPVLMTQPGSGVWLVETLECQCTPWTDAACDACGGSGFIYRRKQAA